MCAALTLIDSNQLMLILFGVSPLGLGECFNPDIVSRGSATLKYLFLAGKGYHTQQN